MTRSWWSLAMALLASGSAWAAKPCEDCWNDTCVELRGAVPKCTGARGQAAPHQAVPDTSPKRCAEGKNRAPETKGNCCWPGQVWGGSRCRGIPSTCPANFLVDEPTESCIPKPCAAGHVRAEDGVTCCWPGQVVSSGTCRGRPSRCPEHFKVVGESCSDAEYQQQELEDLAATAIGPLTFKVPSRWLLVDTEGDKKKWTSPDEKAGVAVIAYTVETPGPAASCLAQARAPQSFKPAGTVAGHPAARSTEDMTDKTGNKVTLTSWFGCDGRVEWIVVFFARKTEGARFEPTLQRILNSISYAK